VCAVAGHAAVVTGRFTVFTKCNRKVTLYTIKWVSVVTIQCDWHTHFFVQPNVVTRQPNPDAENAFKPGEYAG